MADEAFALSPISARATLPSEADYDAISAAFMETSRGRWFLSEYAKRNRNADTSMVLDAVARIEQNLAAQKDAVPDNGLVEALAAIRASVDEAKAAALETIDGRAVEQSLAPIRNGARIIRETLLRLREIGADGRIYDLMDSQVRAIETGCGQLAAADSSASLNAAFDLIEQRISQFAGDGTPPPPSSEQEVSASASMTEVPSVEDETPEASPSEIAPEPAIGFATASPSEDTAIAETDVEAIGAEAALDDALDMIALEMAAPQFAEDDAEPFYAAQPEPVEPEAVAVAQPTENVTAPEPEPSSAQPLQVSLGASLIANGIVLKPAASGVDPLAPIRRMSQAEKIAFFS